MHRQAAGRSLVVKRVFGDVTPAGKTCGNFESTTAGIKIRRDGGRTVTGGQVEAESGPEPVLRLPAQGHLISIGGGACENGTEASRRI